MSDFLVEKIKSLSEDFFEETVAMRRHLHKHPELSFVEFQTAQTVEQALAALGIPSTPMAVTGRVALIEGLKKVPTVRESPRVLALRADLDALPIHEKNNESYTSVHNGVMHACGHDVHTASLLGTARVLMALRAEFSGIVKLIFQPGEEKTPGGANLMINEGVLKNPAPEAIFGQHVMPQLEAGKVGFRAGMYMASSDEIYIKVKGKGGHGAMPDQNVDPVLMAAHLIVALQQIVSRNADPRIPSVLSFGKVSAEGATNVIPNEVTIEGTFRTLNEKWRKDAHKKMRRMGELLCESMGGTCDFNVLPGYPFLSNEKKLTTEAKRYATRYLGEANVIELDLWMASEDFSFYSQQINACFYRLGTRKINTPVTSVHTNTFNVDEQSLQTGIGLMAYLALKKLGN